MMFEIRVLEGLEYEHKYVNEADPGLNDASVLVPMLEDAFGMRLVFDARISQQKSYLDSPELFFARRAASLEVRDNPGCLHIKYPEYKTGGVYKELDYLFTPSTSVTEDILTDERFWLIPASSSVQDLSSSKGIPTEIRRTVDLVVKREYFRVIANDLIEYGDCFAFDCIVVFDDVVARVNDGPEHRFFEVELELTRSIPRSGSHFQAVGGGLEQLGFARSIFSKYHRSLMTAGILAPDEVKRYYDLHAW